jgi:hypothetical protein
MEKYTLRKAYEWTKKKLFSPIENIEKLVRIGVVIPLIAFNLSGCASMSKQISSSEPIPRIPLLCRHTSIACALAYEPYGLVSIVHGYRRMGGVWHSQSRVKDSEWKPIIPAFYEPNPICTLGPDELRAVDEKYSITDKINNLKKGRK